MKVSIIGAGAVGKATGVGLSRVGHKVIFYDIVPGRRNELRSEGFTVAETLDTVDGCDVHMISVPTPVPNGRMDFACIERAVMELASVMKMQERYQVVAIRSTILPFTVRNRILPLLKQHCSLELGKHYGLCHNPEFLREAHALEEFLNPPITVIGTDDTRSAQVMTELYTQFDTTVVVTTPENAEAIKFFSNVYNATKVSFFNQIYLISQELGLDHAVISRSLTRSALGVRIPEYYTKGGYPFGGNCLPKDLAAFTTFVKDQGMDPGFFEEVSRINEVIKNGNSGHEVTQERCQVSAS